MRFPALVEDWKQQAAERALTYVEDGMLVGLGTGSTAAKFVDLLGQRVEAGLFCHVRADLGGDARRRPSAWAFALTTLDDVPFLDLTVDGADELDADLRLIKGGGGALLREKIVAMASERMIVIADASKRVGTLGKFPLPIEAVRFGLTATRTLDRRRGGGRRLHRRDQAAVWQRTGKPFVTDSGNVLFDCAFGRIDNPEALDQALKRVPGVVENGLFLGIADAAIIAGPEGVAVIERDAAAKKADASPDGAKLRGMCDVLSRGSPSPRPSRAPGAAGSLARAQAPDAERLAAAKELMQVAGVAKQFDEVMPYLTSQLAQELRAVAPDKAGEIREVFSQLAVKFVDRKGELIEQIAHLYAEKLAMEDLTALVAFYKSPAGMKFVSAQPDIMRQSMMLGQRWGAQLGREIEQEAREELKKRGIPL